MNFKAKSELLVLVFRINVISNFGCRYPCMDFLPPPAAFSGSPTWGSPPGIPCRRSFGSQGSMKVCRKHTITKKKFLGSIPSGFQWISGGSQGETGRDASASWKMLWIEHTIKALDFLGPIRSAFYFQNRK